MQIKNVTSTKLGLNTKTNYDTQKLINKSNKITQRAYPYSQVNTIIFNDNPNKEPTTEDRIIEKIMPVGIGTNAINTEINVVLPYKYAKTNGKDITSLTQILPKQVTSAKTVKNFTSTKIGNWIANDAYINAVRETNKFYNNGSFIIKESAFGSQVFAETAATIANPKIILKTAGSIPNILGATGGGAIDAILTTGGKYYIEGGFDEVGKHIGEIGGRFVGSSAGGFIGIGTATSLSAVIGAAATGATIGGTAGSVVPIAGNIIGAIGGCIVGAVASTILGDIGADLGTILDGENI